MLDIVVFVWLVSDFVGESGFVKFGSKLYQLFLVLKNQSASRNIVHADKLHPWLTGQLADNGVSAFMALSDRYVQATSSRSQNCLKRIENTSVSSTPFLKNA